MVSDCLDAELVPINRTAPLLPTFHVQCMDPDICMLHVSSDLPPRLLACPSRSLAATRRLAHVRHVNLATEQPVPAGVKRLGSFNIGPLASNSMLFLDMQSLLDISREGGHSMYEHAR